MWQNMMNELREWELFETADLLCAYSDHNYRSGTWCDAIPKNDEQLILDILLNG